MLKTLHIIPTFSDNPAAANNRSVRALDYFDYIQIFPGDKSQHFTRIQQASGIRYEDMLFFDDEARNRNVQTELGVSFCLVRDGMTREEVDRGVWDWRKKMNITAVDKGQAIEDELSKYLKMGNTTNPAHLKPSSSRHSSQKPTTPSYKPPLTTHPSTTISETASFQGIHPISIGAGTVIHPRTKFLSFEGPIKIGDGCIIGEKSVIGGPQTSPTSSAPNPTISAIDTGSSTAPPAATTVTATILENSVSIGPLTTLNAGTHISSAATIDTSVVLGRRVRVGQHAKVCANCCIPDDGVVDHWVVIWGGVGGMGQGDAAGSRLQRRKRANGQHQQRSGEAGYAGAAVEKGRLGVLEKEREGLTKLIGAGGAGGGARRK
ncbi:hypothetical protein ACJ72_08442 [Emergomyces africanus]|uniref:Uncharacterized protein n=1 Tax=Emergomyces africanus TaxID=1955775 RepID=A0A1B7NKH2_9EURO|nr:hypothetical protein ACJ72_08442 [Emergomyces africanus]